MKRAAEEAAEIEKDRAFVVDYDGDATYSPQQTAELATAENQAEEIEKEMFEDMEGEGEDVISAFNTEDFERPAYDAKQRAIMADVRGGGCGTIFVGQRGDFQIARWVLKAKNKQNKARFRYMSATRRIEDPAMAGDWKDSKKFWLYMNKAPHREVVQKIREHPQLDGWEITDLGKQPFDLIANDKQIYFHLRRNAEKGKIDLDNANPALYFHSSRGIRSMKSWMDAKKPTLEPTEW